METASLVAFGASAGGPWALWRVLEDAKPTRIWTDDDLLFFYGGLSGNEEEAGKLYCDAASQLGDEDDESALENALAAVAAFKKLDHSRGIADSVRLVGHLYLSRCQKMVFNRYFGYRADLRNILKNASNMARKELDSFKVADDKFGQAAMVLLLAELALEVENLDEGLELAVKARELFRLFKNMRMEAVCLLVQSNITFKRGDSDKAISTATDSLTLFKRLGDRRGQGLALHACAMAHALDLDLKIAIEKADEAREIFCELQLPRFEIMELHTIARWSLASENYRAALVAAKEAHKLAKETECGRGWEPSALRTLIEVYLIRGEVGAALRVATQPLEAKHDSNAKALLQDALSHIHMARGDAEQARHAGEEAWAFSEDNKEIEMLTTQSWAKLRALSGDANEALGSLEVACELAGQVGNAAHESFVLYEMWELCIHTLNATRAREYANRFLSIQTKLKNRWGDAAGRRLFGQSFAISSTWHKAVEELNLARDSFVRSNQAASVAQAACWIDLAEVFHGQAKESDKKTFAAKSAEAVNAFKTGVQLYEDHGMVKSLSAALTSFAQLFITMRDFGEAYNKASRAAEACKKAMDASGELAAFIIMLQAALQLVTTSNNKVARQGVLNPALKAAVEADKLSVKLGDKASEGVVAFHHVQLAILNGSLSGHQALSMCSAAIDSFAVVADLSSQGHVKLLVAQIYVLQERKAMEAERACREAHQLFLEADDESGCVLAVEALRGMGFGSGASAVTPPIESMQTSPMSAVPKEPSHLVVKADSVKPTRQTIKNGVRQVALEHLEDDALGLDTPLMEAGLDSLASVSLRNDLARKFDLTFPASLLFEYPTLDEISGQIYAQM